MKVILGLDRYSIGVPSCPSESYRHSTRFQIRRIPFYVQRPLFQLKIKAGTKNVELLNIVNNKTDFTEQDIIDRTAKILDSFISYLEANDLLL